MHVSQPAMSRLISGLEAELKLTLFRRERRRLVLTREGAEFYREAERILANLDEIPQIVRDIKSRSERPLRIVALARVASSLVSPAMVRFLEDHPTQRCTVEVRGRRDMEQWVAGRHYDIGVAVSLPCNQPNVVYQTLFRTHAMVMMPPTHPLAEYPTITASQLARHRLVGLTSGTRPRQQMDEIFRAAGVEVRYQLETTSTPLACQLVADGLGVTVTDRLAALSVNPERFVMRPISPSYSLEFGLIFPPGHETTPVLRGFIDCLRQQIRRTLGAYATLAGA
jgi:DNA-binding transcriptional LysR family regulator